MPNDQQTPTPDDDRLKGWKEIAQCLHSSERTVQRWEHTLHLPVYRIGTQGGASIVASRRELEEWLQSIEGRTALSEQDDSESLRDPQADSRLGDAGPSAQGSPTPGMLHDAPGSRAGMANRAGQGRSIWRRFGWALLGLGVVALVIGFVPLARSMGWFAKAPQKAAAPSATTPANGRVTGPSASLVASTVAVRFTLDDRTSSIVGIQVGGTSSVTLENQATYVFSAEVRAEGARVHVSRLEAGTPKRAPRLLELVAVTLRQGARVSVQQIPGITALEWIDLDTLRKTWPKIPQ